MPDVKTEQVLVVPTELFHRLGCFQGFCGEVDRYLEELLSPRHSGYRPREQVVEIVSLHQFMRYACDVGEGKPRSAESLARYVATACAEALDRTVAYRMCIEVRPESKLVIEGVVTG